MQLRFLLTKKRTLEMMECVKEFVNSEVLEVVQQRTDKIKIERTAKVKELQEEARQRKEEQVEHAWQQKKEQEEQARQRKEEQAKQAPKARGKYKTFDE